MSITINGSTNTITAASGLTIAGNTAITGTLSTTSNITQTAASYAAFGGATWPTASIGQSAGRILVGNASGDAYLAIFNGAATTAINEGGRLWLGARGTAATADFAYAEITGLRATATSGDYSTYMQLRAATAGGVQTTVADIRAGAVTITGTLSSTGNLSVGGDSGVNTATISSTNDNAEYIVSAGNGATASMRFNNAAGTRHWSIYETFGAAGQQGSLGIYNEVGTANAALFSSTALTLGSGVNLLPAVDNTNNIGSASFGWKELFCDNGTINTSDARRKTEVSALSAAEINAAKQLTKEIGSFKFLAAVAEKGDAARLHIGMTVQRAIEIMEANGLNPFAYSFICHDAWDQQVVEHAAVEAKDAVVDDEGNVVEPAVEAKDAWTEVTLEAGDKYSFRAHELLLFMAAGFEARLSALEAA